MTKRTATTATARPFRAKSRQAPWLLSDYDNPEWTVKDTDGEDTATINFERRMPEGKLLSAFPKLYQTAKEFAFWVRDPAYTKIDDAQRHKELVHALFGICYCMVLKGIDSFRKLGPLDVDDIARRCSLGSDALTEASARIECFLRLNASHLKAWMVRGRLPRTAIALRTGVAFDAIRGNHVAAEVIARAETYAKGEHLTLEIPEPDEEEDEPKEADETITVQALSRYLFALEDLYAMRRHIEAENLAFKPFPEGASKLAKRLGSIHSRTPTPTPRLALHLLEYSIRMIAEYSDPIISAVMAKPKYDLEIGVPRASQAPRVMLLSQAINLLSAACLVSLNSFAARRSAETMKATRNCLRGGPGGWWLEVHIVKTHNRKELIPIPAVAARAVQVLLKLTDGEDEDLLFRSQIGRQTGFVPRPFKLKPHNHLDKLAEHFEVPLARDGTTWHWTNHQLRRFFAILYFYRYEYGDLEALSHHLRHFSLDMTRRYVTTDPETRAIFMDVEWGYTGELARSIAAGTRVPRGGLDKHLTRLAARITARLRKDMQVATPERVGAAMTLALRRGGVAIIPRPWADCGAPLTKLGAKKAACRVGAVSEVDAVGAALENASVTKCSGCRWASVSDKQADYGLNSLAVSEAEITGSQCSGTLLEKLQAERLIDIRAAQRRLGNGQNGAIQ